MKIYTRAIPDGEFEKFEKRGIYFLRLPVSDFSSFKEDSITVVIPLIYKGVILCIEDSISQTEDATASLQFNNLSDEELKNMPWEVRDELGFKPQKSFGVSRL